jgi:hypothetical protein
VHNRFHWGERITWGSGGEGALDTPGPLYGIERSKYLKYYRNRFARLFLLLEMLITIALLFFIDKLGYSDFFLRSSVVDPYWYVINGPSGLYGCYLVI